MNAIVVFFPTFYCMSSPRIDSKIFHMNSIVFIMWFPLRTLGHLQHQIFKVLVKEVYVKMNSKNCGNSQKLYIKVRRA